MKKIFLLLFIFTCLLTIRVSAVDHAPIVSAQSAVVVHADTGRVLWEKDADREMLIASTTKIMTAIIAIEQCDLESSVEITQEMASVEGSSMYLQRGKRYTVKELLYGLMLASGNDAATALALHTAGDEIAFAALMNQKAAELGMIHTRFENPHGLDGENHYSSAVDMAKLAVYAMENDTFAEIVKTRHITIQGLTYVNHNKLLWQCDGVIGVKTGYTIAAGRTLVTCCERNGQRVICVTLSDRDDWNDHKALYDWVYDAYSECDVSELQSRYEIPLMTGNGECVYATPLHKGTVFSCEGEQAECLIELPRFVFPDVNKGDMAGKVIIKINGTVVCEVPLVFENDYKLESYGWFGSLWSRKIPSRI